MRHPPATTASNTNKRVIFRWQKPSRNVAVVNRGCRMAVYGFGSAILCGIGSAGKRPIARLICSAITRIGASLPAWFLLADFARQHARIGLFTQSAGESPTFFSNAVPVMWHTCRSRSRANYVGCVHVLTTERVLAQVSIPDLRCGDKQFASANRIPSTSLHLAFNLISTRFVAIGTIQRHCQHRVTGRLRSPGLRVCAITISRRNGA